MIKGLLIFSLFITVVFSKECYFNKADETCYYKYFKRSNIYKAKENEEYYVNANGSIYTFDKVLEVRFKSIGAIFTILNDFELEFVDKIKNEIYLFKVDDRADLFPTISKLNRLKTILKAQPHKKRKFTNTYVQRKLEAKRARFNSVMKKAEESLKNKKNKKIEKKVTSSKIKGTFLNPDE